MSDKKINWRLNSPRDVRRVLARTTMMVFNNEIDCKRANAIIYACNSILTSIRVDDQEKRIQELEDALNAINEQDQ